MNKSDNYKLAKQLEQLLDDLSSSKVKVIKNDIIIDKFKDLTKEEREMIFNYIEKKYALNLNPKLKSSLLASSINICWHYKINNSFDSGGEFNIYLTSSSFVNTAKTDFKSNLTPYGKKLYGKGYRFFDSHPHAGDGEVFALKLHDNQLSDHIWHIDLTKKEITPLELDYNQYIDHSIKLKGLYGWQYLFEDIDFSTMDSESSGLGKRLKDYTLLFPHIEITDYVKRYKERGGQFE